MTHIGFYQLGEANVNDVVTMLIQKARGANKKMLIYCPNPAASAIDDALWSHDPDSWLPHGLDAAPGAELASVWVCSDMSSNPIEADCVMLLHGAVPQSWDGFGRAFVVFDGKSDSQLQQARSQWQRWKPWPDKELAYFAQSTDGRWEKKA
jgi:DNA polymerase-3 subunit chi